jgi:hypothetical protein
LRFFVSLFQDYKTYIGREKFLISEFLANCNMSSSSLEFVEKILKTQMFHVFVEERRENPLDPEVRFFDDSITAKINRSKKAALANMGKGKKQTSFLNESFHKVRNTAALHRGDDPISHVVRSLHIRRSLRLLLPRLLVIGDSLMTEGPITTEHSLIWIQPFTEKSGRQ